MKSTVNINCGQTDIIPGKVWFEVSRTDSAIILSLSDSRVNRRYTVAMMDDGLVEKTILPINPHPVPGQTPEEQEPGIVNKNSFMNFSLMVMKAQERRQKQKRSPTPPSKLKMTLRYGIHSRPAHKAWVHGGYRNEAGVVVVLHRRRWNGGVVDELLRLVGEEHYVHEKYMRAATKIDPEDWPRFLALSDGGTFKLTGSDWTKMPLSDLEWLHGRVLKPAQLRDGEPFPFTK